jgi:tetratricopeptide (TPR) repeat protein
VYWLHINGWIQVSQYLQMWNLPLQFPVFSTGRRFAVPELHLWYEEGLPRLGLPRRYVRCSELQYELPEGLATNAMWDRQKQGRILDVRLASAILPPLPFGLMANQSTMICRIPYSSLAIAAILISVAPTRSQAQKYSAPLEKEVVELLRAQKYNEAESAILKSGKSDPFVLAWLKLKQGKKDEGLTMLRHEVAEAKADRVEVALRSIAIISDISLDDATDFSKACLEDATLKDNPKLKFRLSALYLQRKKPEPAIALIDDVLKTSYTGDDLKDGVLNLIVYFYENQHAKQALAYFDKLMAKVPETKLDPGVQLLWARIAAVADLPLEALKKIDIIQSTFPNYYETKKGLFYLSRGIAYEKIGDRKQAKAECVALVQLAERDPKYQPMAAIAKEKIKEFEQREKLEERVKEATAKPVLPELPAAKDAQPRSSTSRVIAIAVSSVLLVVCVMALIWRRPKK